MGMGYEVEEKGTQISEQNWGGSEPELLEKRFQNISLLLASFKSFQSYPTLCDPMDCSPPGSSFHWNSPGKNTGVSCHALLQGIFPTQGSNPGLPHYRQILCCLSHQGSPLHDYMTISI